MAIITYKDDLSIIKGVDWARLSGEPESTDKPNLTVIQKCIDEAESLINGRLGTPFTIPLDSILITPSLKRIAQNITIAYLYEGAVSDMITPESVMLAYDRSIKELEMIKVNINTVGANTTDLKDVTKVSRFGSYTRG